MSDRVQTLILAAHKLRPVDATLSDKVQALAVADPCDTFADYLRQRMAMFPGCELTRRLLGSVLKLGRTV